VGVHKATGEVAWQVVGPSPRVLHGQWSSPAVAEITGRTIALFGGGDGWLYALEANSGREVWRFNGNRSNAVWRISGDIDGLTMRNSIIACPVVHDGVVYLAMGQDPTHGTGKGVLFAIDPRGHGDVTGHRTIWKNTAIGRMIATPVVRDHLIFAADTNGFVHCIDADNGRTIWTDDLLAAVWGGLILAGNHLYVGDEDGQIHVFEADRDKHRKASMKMDSAIWGVPAAANGVLYFVSARRLHAIGR
jgi:outer membrane protein assembly factor BamB